MDYRQNNQIEAVNIQQENKQDSQGFLSDMSSNFQRKMKDLALQLKEMTFMGLIHYKEPIHNDQNDSRKVPRANGEEQSKGINHYNRTHGLKGPNQVKMLMIDLRQAKRNILTEIIREDKKTKESMQHWIFQIVDFCKTILSHQHNDIKAESLVQTQKAQKSQSSSDIFHYERRVSQLQTQLTKHQLLLKEKDRLIRSLSIQNQHLNQAIFDYQQRIVGFDLQLEQRLKEAIDRGETGKIREQYLKTIQELNQQIEELSQRYDKNRQLARIDGQDREEGFRIRERQLAFREKQLELRDQQIFQRWQQIEYQKEHNNNKQTQLQKMEDDLQRRLGDLIIKENQLEIMKHQVNQNFKHFNNQTKKHAPINITNNSSPNNYPTTTIHNTSLNSNDRHPLYNKERTRQYTYTSYQQFNKPQSIDRNLTKNNPITGKNGYGSSGISSALKGISNNPMGKDFEGNQLKNLAKTPIRENIKTYQGSVVGNIVNKFSGSTVSHQAGQTNHNLNGIQSKLERLKQEIRKEIDSIK